MKDLLGILADAPGEPRQFYAEIKTDPQRPEESSDTAALSEAVLRDLAEAGWIEYSRVIAFD